MLKIGLTGGIGSGKSYISEIFKHLNISVYVADSRTKELYIENEELKSKMIDAFGQEVYLGSGTINTEYLRKLIFNDNVQLKLVNSIVHPIVMSDFNNWCDERKDEKYVIKESAILFETGLYWQLDKTILVTAQTDIRVERIQKRENVPVEEIKKKIHAQWTDDDKSKFADFIIKNDDNSLLLPQVLSIHEKILSL